MLGIRDDPRYSLDIAISGTFQKENIERSKE